MLSDIAEKANATSRRKGFWSLTNKTVGDIVALIHTEVSEVMEEYRKGHRNNYVYAGDKSWLDPTEEEWDIIATLANNGIKPKGIPLELADIILRVLDFAEEEGIDMDAAVAAKMLYNETRPYRHDKIM